MHFRDLHLSSWQCNLQLFKERRSGCFSTAGFVLLPFIRSLISNPGRTELERNWILHNFSAFCSEISLRSLTSFHHVADCWQWLFLLSTQPLSDPRLTCWIRLLLYLFCCVTPLTPHFSAMPVKFSWFLFLHQKKVSICPLEYWL